MGPRACVDVIAKRKLYRNEAEWVSRDRRGEYEAKCVTVSVERDGEKSLTSYTSNLLRLTLPSKLYRPTLACDNRVKSR